MNKALLLLQPILAVCLGLTLGLTVTFIAGENPLHVLQILVRGAFGTSYDCGMTLYYATPLIFTGLSVSLAFYSGLFNIGAEGQMLFGALAAAALGNIAPTLGAPWAASLAWGVAFLAGLIWAGIPGWLRARRGSHEVINTIMLNFVAAGLCSWATLYLFKNPNSQVPETAPVGPAYLVPHLSWFGDAPVSAALLGALCCAALFWFLLWKTVIGFEIRAVGQNEDAARCAGINVGSVRIIAMMLAGGLAGLAGLGEVLGNTGRFRIDFSPGYGFMGIAVALLGRNHPVGIVFAALLFAALHKGTADLDLETEYVTRDLSQILQALVILCVSADALWDRLRKKGVSHG